MTRYAYHFERQMSIGEKGEQAFLKYMRAEKQVGTIARVIDVRSDEAHQKQDIDFAVICPSGERITYEVKCDAYSSENIFVETQINDYYIADGHVVKGDFTQGWLYRSRADYIFYYFRQSNAAYVLNRVSLAYWIDRELARLDGTREEIRPRAAMNNGEQPAGRTQAHVFYGVGYLVPVRLLIAGGCAVRKVELSEKRYQGLLYRVPGHRPGI